MESVNGGKLITINENKIVLSLLMKYKIGRRYITYNLPIYILNSPAIDYYKRKLIDHSNNYNLIIGDVYGVNNNYRNLISFSQMLKLTMNCSSSFMTYRESQNRGLLIVTFL